MRKQKRLRRKLSARKNDLSFSLYYIYNRRRELRIVDEKEFLERGDV